MTLAKVTGMPIIPVGHANRAGAAGIFGFSNVLMDAANEAIEMIGYFYWEDGGSHTIDTTGSSSIQVRAGAVTFADAGTTMKVGIAAIDTATGPPGRAVNAANVITFDVEAAFTGGGGGITANAWQTLVPTTGTKTIASGDLVAICGQMTARGGADAINFQVEGAPGSAGFSGVTTYLGGSYADSQSLPNAVVVASDGTRGYIFNSYVATTATTTQTWNSGSATKEYGNILRFPFPVRAYGIIVACSFAGNTDIILYSAPLGTPVAERTVSVDLNTVVAASATAETRLLFSSPYDLAANTDYAVIAKPTSGTNIGMIYKTYNAASHQNSDVLGTDCYAVNRASGAFGAQNSSKDRFAIGLLVGAFDAGGSTGGISRARAAGGW